MATDCDAGQRDIPLDGRTRLKVLCKVRYMSFSAHADTTGIQQLARHLQPKAVMLVHGEKEGMLKLARVLQRELGVPVHTPPTGQTVSVALDRVGRHIPVYIHNLCLRRNGSSAVAVPLPNRVSWECDDPAVSYFLSNGRTSPGFVRSAYTFPGCGLHAFVNVCSRNPCASLDLPLCRCASAGIDNWISSHAAVFATCGRP